MSRWIWTLVALGVLLTFDLIFTPGFFSIVMKDGHLFGSLIDVLNRAAPVMLVAIGMTLVISTGGVDLSVGAVIAISGSIAALLVTKSHASMPAVLAISLGASLALGLWNGFLIAYLGIQPIVATLVLMVSGRGIAQLVTDGQIITFDDPGLSFMGGGHFLALPFSLTLVLCALALAALVTRRTAIGLFMEATGDNETAARHSGINTRAVRMFAYSVVAVCAGIAGLVVAGETKGADATNAGLYLELDAILAVVLGGTALTGGRFSFIGSLIGALLIQALTTTILTRGVPVEWTLVVKALAVLAVCLVQSPAFRTRVFGRRRAVA